MTEISLKEVVLELRGSLENMRNDQQRLFDRQRDEQQDAIEKLHLEIVERDHAKKGSLDQITVQLATLIKDVGYTSRTVDNIERWRREGGPLDARMVSQGNRIGALETWQNRVIGAMILLGLLFPATIGVLVAVLKG